MAPLIKRSFIDKLVASNSIVVHVGVMISLRTCVAKCQIFDSKFHIYNQQRFQIHLPYSRFPYVWN